MGGRKGHPVYDCALVCPLSVYESGTWWTVPQLIEPLFLVIFPTLSELVFCLMLLFFSKQKDFQLENCSQRRAGSNWRLFLIMVQRMYTYQLTIDKEFHSFASSFLPVAHFLCLPCVGSERGLAAYLLGSGLTLLLLSSLFSSSPRGTTLLAGLEYLINPRPLGRSGLSTWKYQFSYDHWSQATLSSVSTWMGDCSSVAWVLLLTLKVG